MIQILASEIALATGGKLIGEDTLVTAAVETDSRLVTPGSLFVAKRGEVTDGHLFVDAAASAGAVVAIVEQLIADSKVTQVLVSDSVEALG